MKILMVCYGNICRSPMAEGILQRKAFDAGLAWSVESAGTSGNQQGNPAHHLAIKVTKLHGIDIRRHRARKFVAHDFSGFDHIYALSADVLDEMKHIAGKAWDEKKATLLMNELWPGSNMDVPDPWYGPENGFHEVYRLLSDVCDVIIDKYARVQRDHFAAKVEADD